MAGDKKTVPLVTVSVQNLHYCHLAEGNLANPENGYIPNRDKAASIAEEMEST